MDDQVIILHADGRTYSVPREAAARLYPDFAIVGEETDAAFELVGIPTPKAPRRSPRAKGKGKAKAAPAVDGTEGEPG